MSIRMCTAHRTSEHRRWWNYGWTCLVYQMDTCTQARCSKASHGSGENNGILRTRRVLNIRLSVTLISSYTWFVSLVSLLRWNKEECKRNKLFVITVITQECYKGGIACLALQSHLTILLLFSHNIHLACSTVVRRSTPPQKKNPALYHLLSPPHWSKLLSCCLGVLPLFSLCLFCFGPCCVVIYFERNIPIP